VAGINGRLGRLEERARTQERAGTSPEQQEKRSEAARAMWEMECEFIAHALVAGFGTSFGADEEGNFYAPDGRLAVGPDYLDFEALFGKRTEELVAAIPPDRWERFLVADEEAADLLEQLRARAEASDVPEDYREPNHKWHDHAEVSERVGGPHVMHSTFADADEREATRRMAWTLIRDQKARRLLSELLRRRDAFVASLDLRQE